MELLSVEVKRDRLHDLRLGFTARFTFASCVLWAPKREEAQARLRR